MNKKGELTLNFDELMAINPEQIWIELSPEEQEKAWQQTQKHSNSASRCNAYLNYISLHTFVNWVKEDPDLQETLKLWPSEAYLPSLWEIVNGTKLTLGETRLVLIPTDKSDFSEFRIPQEWVDIPNWTANYYLAIQINLDEDWLRVCGYATHEQIQKQGRYDRIDRTYSLDKDDLVEDLNVMWLAREFFTAKKLEVKPLSSLSAAQTERLLEQLSKQTNYSPRLDVTFEEWAALIANDESRQQLYQKRLLNEQNNYSNARNTVFIKNPVSVGEVNETKANDLSLWFQNIFEAGWQSLDTLLRIEQKTLAYQFRTDSTLNEFRIKTVKLIDLGMELKGIAVILLVCLTLETDKKVGIRVQLHPAKVETYLPQNLKLGLLSESGAMLQEVQSRSHDNYIQLKRFKSPAGKGFSIQVSLGEANIKEDFVFYQALSAEKNG